MFFGVVVVWAIQPYPRVVLNAAPLSRVNPGGNGAGAGPNEMLAVVGAAVAVGAASIIAGIVRRIARKRTWNSLNREVVDTSFSPCVAHPHMPGISCEPVPRTDVRCPVGGLCRPRIAEFPIR
jgi:hypothetical protein